MGTLKVRESGAWNPIGLTNADEVWVGPDTPVSPSAELWYDTDEDSSSVVDQTLAWNNAWGMVNEARWSSSWSSASTSSQVITAASGTNTFTAYLYASRRYRLYWQGMVTSTAAGDYIVLQHQVNGVSISENNAQYIAAANVQIFTWVESRYIPAADGNYTFAMTGRRSSASTGTVSVINTGNNPLWLMVEDLGPISRVGVSPPAGQPLATTLGNALGVVAVGSTTNQVGLSIAANTWTNVTTPLSVYLAAGRRYRIRIVLRAVHTTDQSNRPIESRYALDGSTYGSRLSNFAGLYHQVSDTWILDGDGATHAVNVQLMCAVALTVYNEIAAGCSEFYVEDVGPTTSPPLPVPAQPAPWLPVTYQTGWQNYGAPFNFGSFRKIGDEVSLRGLITQVAGAGGTVLRLPAGFRPSGQIIQSCLASSGQARYDIQLDGYFTTSTGISAGNWICLDGIRFSVT